MGLVTSVISKFMTLIITVTGLSLRSTRQLTVYSPIEHMPSVDRVPLGAGNFVPLQN